MAAGRPFGMTPVGRFVIDADHPCLPGHFPGTPVVPGALLLDAALALVLDARPGQRLAGVATAKFTAVVGPGDVVEVAAGPGGGRCAVECRVAGTVVARATAMLAGSTP